MGGLVSSPWGTVKLRLDNSHLAELVKTTLGLVDGLDPLMSLCITALQ